MVFELTILGCNSAAPAFNRHQTSQHLQIDNHFILIDCGDGTQMQLQRYGMKLNRINKIFISHLHGDHFFGLVGLISSMHLHGRKTTLQVYGPPGLDEILTIQFRYSETVFNFPIEYHEVDVESPTIVFEDQKLTVTAYPMDHRITCFGYLFREKPKRLRINKEKIDADFPVAYINVLKNGEDVYHEDGSLRFDHRAYTLPARKSRSYAFLADTRYSNKYAIDLRDIDLLYHESTFTQEHQERASQTYHSTAAEAAAFAKEANVGKLLLGHYSTRYRDLNVILEEALDVFERSELSLEGKRIAIQD